MFIIKWVTPKQDVYYKCVKNILCTELKIGYVNQFGHEIIDINYIYNNRVWTYDEYLHGLYHKKNNVFFKLVHTLNKLNK